MSREAFFLPMAEGRRGQRFCMFHPSASASSRGGVVYVHAFAEEMNKSRRMAALQARAFADSGYAVLQIDLLGCGDSSGDFGDATWHDWVDDVVEASHWMQRRERAPLWLWGLRAGCLVAVEAAQKLDSPCRFLFWQAPAAGKALLHQFLRLKLAGNLVEGRSRGVLEGLRQQLASGSAVDVAGYQLAPGLAAGFGAAKLQPPTLSGRLEWIELSSRTDPALSTASEPILTDWRVAGFDVKSRVVNGPAFWQTNEIEDAPALIDASVAALAAPAETVAA
jgi:exosortase A-associated hydrolase 2